MDKITEDIKQEVKSLYLSNKNFREISEILNIGQTTAWKIIKEFGIKTRKIKKLNELQESQICKDYLNGQSSLKLSKKYNISDSVVRDYLKKNEIKIKSNEEYKKYSLDKNIFYNLKNENILWFYGWLWTDGCNKVDQKTCQITAHSQDKETLIKLNKVIDNNRSFYSPKKSNCKVLLFSSKEISNYLESLGCTANKSLLLEYPNWIKEKECHQAFLRGVFEGDGSIYFRNSRNFGCEISSGSKSFLLSIQKIILNFLGLETKIYERKDSNSKRIVIKGGNKNCIKFLDFIYDNSKEHNRMNRKHVLYLKAKEINKNPTPRIDSNFNKYKTFYIKSPTNEIIKSNCVNKFCREFNLNNDCLRRVLNKKLPHYKGYHIPDIKSIKKSNIISLIYDQTSSIAKKSVINHKA